MPKPTKEAAGPELNGNGDVNGDVSLGVRFVLAARACALGISLLQRAVGGGGGGGGGGGHMHQHMRSNGKTSGSGNGTITATTTHSALLEALSDAGGSLVALRTVLRSVGEAAIDLTAARVRGDMMMGSPMRDGIGALHASAPEHVHVTPSAVKIAKRRLSIALQLADRTTETAAKSLVALHARSAMGLASVDSRARSSHACLTASSPQGRTISSIDSIGVAGGTPHPESKVLFHTPVNIP